MKTLLRIGICWGMGCLLSGGLMAQRGGGGRGGGATGGHTGGGFGGGFRGGAGVGGFRGGFGGGRGYSGGVGRFGAGFGRGFYGGYYWPGFYGGAYLGSPYYGYWDDPYAYSSSPYISATPSYSPGYEYNPSPNVTVIYPATPQPQPMYAAPVQSSPQPVMRSYDQYGQEVQPATPATEPAIAPSNGSPIYLIAMKDQAIRAAAAYWVDGRTLHYVTLQHEAKQAPLDSVDRPLSMQLNRERRVPFQLPQ